jgi:CRISPR/Cas system-associated exonuclease Cas4 (RecB family)
MPIKQVQRVTSWSFSRWKDWTKCPALFKYKHIDKVAISDDNAATFKGSDVHTDSEAFVMGTLKVLPKSVASFKPEFMEIRKSKLKHLVEQQWAFTVKWAKAAWFGADAWCRVMMDVHCYDHEHKHLRVIDIKSGKKYPDDHALQAELYALAGFIMYPSARTLRVELWYTDLGEMDPYDFAVGDVARLKKEWLARITPMLNDTKFVTRPGRHCAWCVYSKAKAGPCKY